MSNSSGIRKPVVRMVLELLAAAALLALPVMARAHQWSMGKPQQPGQWEDHGYRSQMKPSHEREHQYDMGLTQRKDHDQLYRMTLSNSRSQGGERQKAQPHGNDRESQLSPYQPDVGDREWQGRRQLRPGEALHELPQDYDTIHSRKGDYYLHDGYFFLHSGRGFVVARQPVGAVFQALPASHIPVSIEGSRYFFCDGAYFQRTTSGYEAVKPPHPAASATTTAVANVAELNVRLGPGTNYGVIDDVNDGTELPVYGHSANWYYVQTHDGTFGWVRVSSTVPMQLPQG